MFLPLSTMQQILVFSLAGLFLFFFGAVCALILV